MAEAFKIKAISKPRASSGRVRVSHGGGVAGTTHGRHAAAVNKALRTAHMGKPHVQSVPKGVKGLPLGGSLPGPENAFE